MRLTGSAAPAGNDGASNASASPAIPKAFMAPSSLAAGPDRTFRRRLSSPAVASTNATRDGPNCQLPGIVNCLVGNAYTTIKWYAAARPGRHPQKAADGG